MMVRIDKATIVKLVRLQIKSRMNIYNGIILFLLLLSRTCLAQLDSIHWIPPMYASDPPNDQYIYLSTPSTTSFIVTIKDGAGNVLATPSLSNATPFRYSIGTGTGTPLFVTDGMLNNVQMNKGFILQANKKFYANVRLKNGSQAGSLTAKGRAGAGNTFRVSFIPVFANASYRNNFCSIMATEDNTTVTVSGYNPNVVFHGIPTVTSNSLTISLNAGETYTFASKFNVNANKTGLIGALISSDKPVVVNNGNFLGALELTLVGQDILIDQSVPTNILGTEYISIRGNGLNSMEQVLVVAHQDNTDVFVNGNPTAVTNLNAGQWFLINSSFYQGTGHKNMYIQTSNPAYCVQSLGGSASAATYGMNLLAPLSCILPTTIDLIPDVDKIGSVNFNGGLFIVTRSGATVSLNGTVQTGAQAVTGTPNWETYKISGLTGNQKIVSTGNLIGGIFGVNGDMGWAGYFSGFDKSPLEITSLPNITTQDSCGSVLLDAPSQYTSYDWYFNNSSISTATPPLPVNQPGNYFVVMTDNFGCIDTAYNSNVKVYQLPTAQFTYNDTCLGFPSSFINSSTINQTYGDTIINHVWASQPDNTISATQDFTMNYNTSGLKNISLIVETNNGCKDTVSHTIEIYPLPHSEFLVLDTCEYTAVTFTDASSIPPPENLARWSWDIDNDGTEEYNIQNPTHNYTAGTYTAKLTVTSANGCSKDTTMPVVTYPKPNADFTFTEKCLYDSLPFVDASTVSSPDVIVAHVWNFGENPLPAVDAQMNTPYYSYQSEGTYTVTEVVASINGCLDTVSKNVNVFAVPNANFTFANVCQSDTAHFIDASTISLGNITGWNWDFGDLNYSTNQDENHHYAQDGTYTVQHIATSDNGCKDTIEQDIVIYPMPQVAFSMQNACLEQTIPFTDNSIINSPGVLNQWTWNFGDNTPPVSLQNPLHLYQNPDTYSVTLTVTSTDNCTSNFQQDVTVYPLPLVSFTASEVCENQPPTVFTNTSTIQSGSNVGFSWEFGDNNSSTSALENPTFNYGRHGDFVVQLAVTSDMGCMDTIVDTIKVKHKPTAIFVQDTTGGCAPICVNFASQSTDSIGIQNWNWWFENGYGEGSHKYEGYCYENAGTYDVKLIVENTVGCFDTVEALGLINTYPYPIADFELTPENTTVDNAEITFTNNSTDAITWIWDFDDNTLDSIEYEPTHVYSDTGNYTVELTVYNANGCFTNVYHQVIITPIENIYIPTAFSPNGDGENDVLYVRGYLNGMAFNIFDRWGKKVFEATNQSMGWDGTINNKPAMEGVYYWYLVTTINGKKKTYTGDVSLMR